MRLLRACLLDEPLPRLMAMADLWDAALEVASPRDVAEALALHMLQPNLATHAKAELPPEAQTALETLLKNKGKLPLAHFERRFGQVRPMGPGKLERERPWLSPQNAHEILWYRGFIFRAFDRAPNTPNEMVFTPTDLAERLETRADDKQQTTNYELPSPVINLQSPVSPLLSDVTTLLIHIQNSTVRVRTNGEWVQEGRQALLPMLHNADGVADNPSGGRFALLLFLMDQLGWLRVQDGRLRLIPQPVTNWLQSNVDQQRLALFNTWRESDAWNDLAHVPALSLEMTHAWANNPLQERELVVREFAKWQTETNPADTSAFADHIHQTHPDFCRTDGRYDTWHVRDAASGEFLNGFEHWHNVEGRLIAYLVDGPVTWLEANQIGTPISSVQSLVVLSEHATVTIPAAQHFQRFQLARIADWHTTREDAFDYKLTPRSLARAQEQGITPLRVIEFLEKATEAALPANIQKAILRWGENGAEAKTDHVVLLKTKDGATMEQLLANAIIRRAMLERLAPNCIALRTQDAERVNAEIVASGLLVD